MQGSSTTIRSTKTLHERANTLNIKRKKENNRTLLVTCTLEDQGSVSINQDEQSFSGERMITFCCKLLLPSCPFLFDPEVRLVLYRKFGGEKKTRLFFLSEMVISDTFCWRIPKEHGCYIIGCLDLVSWNLESKFLSVAEFISRFLHYVPVKSR